MNENPTIKQQRSLMFLELMMEGNDLAEISLLLDSPLSTIQKHDNALKRLTGRLGQYVQNNALDALAKVDAGHYQVDSIKAYTDHKMVSDLVAMRWAVVKRCEAIAQEDVVKAERKALAEAASKSIQVKKGVIELRLRNQFRAPIETLTEALDAVLVLTPEDADSHLLQAFADLTEAVIEVEEVLMS
jgi:hypothetical protein